MTKNEIINEIVKNKTIEKVASEHYTYIGGTNLDDFIQEVLLILCEMSTNKITKLYEDGQLIFYLISIVHNQAKNYKSTFNKKYHRDFEVLCPEIFDSSMKETDEDKDWEG